MKGPWRITFDTNPDLCNIHCIMCEEHSDFKRESDKQNRIMPFKIIENVIKNVASYGLKEIVPSTMGEPLLYPKFEKIIELIKEHDLKLNLTTNGTFPRLGVEKWGNLILPIASDIKISINGAFKDTAEKIMNGINFTKQLSSIKKIIELRNKFRGKGINYPTITFQTTYLESNLRELPDLLKLAIKLNADRFKGHHLWITHPELSEESLRRNNKAIQKWNNIVMILRKIAERHRLRNGKKILLANVYPLSKDCAISRGFICPFLGREAWIAWNGTFNVCCAPNNLRQSLGNYGNVFDTNFMDLWNSQEYNNLINNWGNFEVCKKCNMRRPMNELRGF